MEPATERKALGQVIRALRELDGLSRDELAERSALGTDMIAKVEQGAKSPSASALKRIASTLGVSAVELSNRGLTWATLKDSPEASTALLRTIAAGSNAAVAAVRSGRRTAIPALGLAASALPAGATVGAVGAAALLASEVNGRRTAERALRARLEQRLSELEQRLDEADSMEDLAELADALDAPLEDEGAQQ